MKDKRNSTIFWNKNRKKYNCGAYALNLKYWYMPFSNTFIREKHIINLIYEQELPKEEIYKVLLNEDKLSIIKQFSYLAPIAESEIKSIPTNIEVIAYRIGLVYSECSDIDTDFHFKVRINGQWSEKIGKDFVRKCRLAAQKPWNYGDLDYDSPIIYFKNLKKN